MPQMHSLGEMYTKMYVNVRDFLSKPGLLEKVLAKRYLFIRKTDTTFGSFGTCKDSSNQMIIGGRLVHS